MELNPLLRSGPYAKP